MDKGSVMIEEVKPNCDLEVDGGIDEATAPLTVAAGANVLVAGSSIFGAGTSVCSAMRRLRRAIYSEPSVRQTLGGASQGAPTLSVA